MRHLIAFCLTLFFALPAFAGFDPCAADAKRHYAPILGHYGHHVLFEAVRCGVPPSYILGTYHSDEPRVYKGVAAAIPPLEGSEVAAFEYLEPKNASEIVERYMYIPKDSKQDLRALLGPKRFAQLTAAFHARFPDFMEDMIARLQPWAAAVLLQYPAQHYDHIVLDDRFKLLAKQLNKPQVGLETLESQLRIFTDFTPRQQLSLLIDTLDFAAQSKEIERQLVDAYLDHDLPRIESLVPQSVTLTHDPAFTKLLMNRLLYQRNRAMVEAALPLVAKGHAFIAVGALHLPGETGILHKLEQNGYYILPVD
jgi:uncharacterized protein YbaP (TraB family)